MKNVELLFLDFSFFLFIFCFNSIIQIDDSLFTNFQITNIHYQMVESGENSKRKNAIKIRDPLIFLSFNKDKDKIYIITLD
jgi:hypothetical protein